MKYSKTDEIYERIYERIVSKLRHHLSSSPFVTACFFSHAGVCMTSSDAVMESEPASAAAASAAAASAAAAAVPVSAPLLVSTVPERDVGVAHCAVIPEGLKIGKINFSNIGAVAGVSEIFNNTKKPTLGPDGSQPNNILYIMRECVQYPLRDHPTAALPQLCSIMQNKIREGFFDELSRNVVEFIQQSQVVLQKVQEEITAIKSKSKSGDSKLLNALERLDAAVIDLHSQEQLARNLGTNSLFKSHVDPPCVFNKLYARNSEREKFPSPDWHIILFARDGSLLVANIAEIIKGKPTKSRSRPWAIVEPMDQIDPDTIDQEYGMDLLTLVEIWKKRTTSDKSDKTTRDVTTQDILAFLSECGTQEAILVDCTCSVFIDDSTVIYCDPSKVSTKSCKKCGKTYDTHLFGGGVGVGVGVGGCRRAYIKTVKRRNKVKAKVKSKSHRRRPHRTDG
jgi:hypothetical protein